MKPLTRERVREALRRTLEGISPMRISADETDIDLVLEDTLDLLDERDALKADLQRIAETWGNADELTRQLHEARAQVAALVQCLSNIIAADELGYGNGPTTMRMAAKHEARMLLAERRGDDPPLASVAAEHDARVRREAMDDFLRCATDEGHSSLGLDPLDFEDKLADLRALAAKGAK